MKLFKNVLWKSYKCLVKVLQTFCENLTHILWKSTNILWKSYKHLVKVLQTSCQSLTNSAKTLSIIINKRDTQGNNIKHYGRVLWCWMSLCWVSWCSNKHLVKVLHMSSECLTHVFWMSYTCLVNVLQMCFESLANIWWNVLQVSDKCIQNILKSLS